MTAMRFEQVQTDSFSEKKILCGEGHVSLVGQISLEFITLIDISAYSQCWTNSERNMIFFLIIFLEALPPFLH